MLACSLAIADSISEAFSGSNRNQWELVAECVRDVDSDMCYAIRAMPFPSETRVSHTTFYHARPGDYDLEIALTCHGPHHTQVDDSFAESIADLPDNSLTQPPASFGVKIRGWGTRVTLDRDVIFTVRLHEALQNAMGQDGDGTTHSSGVRLGDRQTIVDGIMTRQDEVRDAVTCSLLFDVDLSTVHFAATVSNVVDEVGFYVVTFRTNRWDDSAGVRRHLSTFEMNVPIETRARPTSARDQATTRQSRGGSDPGGRRRRGARSNIASGSCVCS